MPSLYWSQPPSMDTKSSFKTRPWYFGDIPKHEAERLLLRPSQPNGSFLVRYSEHDPHAYTLSVRQANSVLNLRITRLPGGFKFRHKAFATLDDFVQYLRAEHLIDGVVVTLDDSPPKTDVNNNLNVNNSNTTTTSNMATKLRRLEISRDQLRVDQTSSGRDIVLGSGNFGRVKRGAWNYQLHHWMPVAIKSLRHGRMKPDDFLGEARLMADLKHGNLVRLYGVCTTGPGPLLIITELMSGGSLVRYLLANRREGLPQRELVFIASQVAAGMAYLEERRFIHRDLAARNVLIKLNTQCSNTDHHLSEVKIADFGLARHLTTTAGDEPIYIARTKSFPVRWTAPEAATEHGHFSTKSDVWSFGVLLYELWTYGQLPYAKFDNDEVLDNVALGFRLFCPDGCPPKLYSLMLRCWHQSPQRRPHFHVLHAMLLYYLERHKSLKED